MKLSGTAKKFVANFGWIMGQQVYSLLLSLVVGSLSARYLGPSNYGLLNYGESILAFFTIISRLGLESVLINEMLRTPEKRGSYLGTALVMRLLTSIGSLFCIMGIVRVLEPDNQVLHVITLLQSFAVILQTYEVFDYWFQMELKMKYVSIATMIALTVVGVWRVTLLATEATVYFFALSGSVQYLVCGGVVVFLFLRQRGKDLKLSFNRKDGTALLRKSYHFIISSLAVTLYTQIDKIMIGKFLDTKALGVYSVAAAVAILWECIPNALIRSARPLIIKQREANREEYIRRFQYLLLGITLLSVTVGIGISLFGKFIVWFLYGESYLEAARPLSILIWSTGFAMIGTARGIWIVAEGHNRYVKYYVFIGAIINFVMNLAVIPFFGITGAAVATLISQIVVALLSPLLFKQTRPFVVCYFQAFKWLPELVKMAVSAIRRRR